MILHPTYLILIILDKKLYYLFLSIIIPSLFIKTDMQNVEHKINNKQVDEIIS